MVETSSLGTRIKAVRLRCGLSQDQFATRLGYSKRALTNWESDAVEPPLAILPTLRREFDVDPEWVVLGEDTTPRSYYGQVDWHRFERIERDVDAVCVDVGLDPKPGRRAALSRALFDSGSDAGEATRKQLRDTLSALSRED